MWIIWSGGVAAAIIAALLVAGSAISLRRTSDNRATAMKRDTSAAAHTRAVEQARAALAAKVRVAPASGTRNVAPGTPVVVTAGVGRLTGVQLLSSSGAAVE